MLGLVWLPYAAFGLISRSVAPLVTSILSDLHMSYSEMGLVLGSWQLTYIVVGILAGSITDRFGVRRAVPEPHSGQVKRNGGVNIGRRKRDLDPHA